MHIAYKFFCQDGQTPVCIASYNGHTDLVDLLVEAGADIHLAETKVYIYLVHTGSCVLSIRLIEGIHIGLIKCVWISISN